VFPDFGGFLSLAQRGKLIPVYRELLADELTPVAAFRRLGRGRGSFLLESVVGGVKWGAYSFIGAEPYAHVAVRSGRAVVERHRHAPMGVDSTEPEIAEREAADPAALVAALVAEAQPVAVPGLPRFWGGAVGCFAYDTVRGFERLGGPPGPRAVDDLGLADARFVLTDGLVIFDNLRQTVKVVACARLGSGVDPKVAHAAACERIERTIERLRAPATPTRSLDGPLAMADELLRGLQPSWNTDAATFRSSVERAKEYIRAGDAFQVVLSRRAELHAALDSLDVYRALRVIDPSPYMFHLELGAEPRRSRPTGDDPCLTVTGASPEVLVRLEGGRVEVRPIAGTRPRGATPDEDDRFERELRGDAKELAEHAMLVDLGRNDVGRVSRAGTVVADELMTVERYSHVMHLVSQVRGEIKAGVGPAEVLRAAFPAGTLSGAPKIRAMEIIDELEPTRRGLYGGAVGYFGYGGTADFAIAIRTLARLGERLFVQAGAGIVHDSDAAKELQETADKARAVLRAIAVAQAVAP
jgi:anthranilate synthase component 1